MHYHYNTPPVFSIYVTLLVTRWLKNTVGGLQNMEEINRKKAQLVYQAIDSSEGFYKNWAQEEDRSLMNVAFNLLSVELEKRFYRPLPRLNFRGWRSIAL